MNARPPTSGSARPFASPFTLDALFPEWSAECRSALLPAERPAPPPSAPAFPPTDFPDFAPAAVPPGESPAVAAALGCPDLFLVSAAGPERERFVRCAVGLALARGERILLVAPTPDAANRWAEVFPTAVRAVAADESPADWPPGLAGRSSQARGAGQARAAHATLTDAVREAETATARYRAALPIWLSLAAADAEDGTSLGKPDESPAGTSAAAELAQLRQQLAELGTPADAKKANGVFSGRFWKSMFGGNAATTTDDVGAKIRALEERLVEIAKADSDAATARHEAARREERFRARCEELRALGFPPPESVAELPAAREAFDRDHHHAAAGFAYARRCLADVDPSLPAPAARFLSRSRLVVAPFGALDDLAVTAARFDRLLLDGAEHATDALARLATAHADRWLLVGRAPLPLSSNRNGSHALPGIFSSLWSERHRPLWANERGRLVRHLAECVGPLTREPLADRPSVELRFGTTAAGDYVLAEVAFADEPIAAAKELLARELGDCALTPPGTADWTHTPGGWVAAWADAATGTPARVAEGILETAIVADGLPVTVRVAFAPGWTREHAEAWIVRHAPCERTAVLVASQPAPEACLV